MIAGGGGSGGGMRGGFGGRGGDMGGALSRELIDETQSLTAPPATDADDATAGRMWAYIALSKSTESDSGKTSSLTAHKKNMSTPLPNPLINVYRYA